LSFYPARPADQKSVLGSNERFGVSLRRQLQTINLADVFRLVACGCEFGAGLSGFFLEELLQFFLTVQVFWPTLKLLNDISFNTLLFQCVPHAQSSLSRRNSIKR
jgi:hypothetical protein